LIDDRPNASNASSQSYGDIIIQEIPHAPGECHNAIFDQHADSTTLYCLRCQQLVFNGQANLPVGEFRQLCAVLRFYRCVLWRRSGLAASQSISA
jgi:hypothetical protein